MFDTIFVFHVVNENDVKKDSTIGVAVTWVQKIESTNFRVCLVIGGNEVNLGFYFNSTRTKRLRDVSIAHVLKLSPFHLCRCLGHCLI
jgi:hypothetical protein